MKHDWMQNDRVISHIEGILDRCAGMISAQVESIILYGSRAVNDFSSQSEYELLVFIKDDTDMQTFIHFKDLVRLELIKEKFFRVNILLYTPSVFEQILYNDSIVGTFLFIICRDHVILTDRNGSFTSLKRRLASNNVKSEEQFLTQCIEFSRAFGSGKWKEKYEKLLMQVKYKKSRSGK